MQLTPYLFFNGDCAEALKLYERCLGARILARMTWAEAPMADQMPKALHDKVMHFHMEIDGSSVMGGDAPPERYNRPQGFFVAIRTGSIEQAERMFADLSEKGVVREPIGETFFALRFGMLVDRFGTPWMVLCERSM
ncbi:MAG TPA: VOC family protein [Candidatus Limnocylindrales bacterium]|nr:VOC family protein [Candidatus Limnocylindrales bacterium]